MSLRFPCPHCGTVCTTARSNAGKPARCPCGKTFTIPAGPPAAASSGAWLLLGAVGLTIVLGSAAGLVVAVWFANNRPVAETDQPQREPKPPPARVVPPPPPKEQLRWRFAYDDAGRLLQATDPAGRSTSFDYRLDANKRLQAAVKHSPDGSRVRWEYNSFGRRTLMDDGSHVKYDHDDFGRLAKVSRAGAPAIAYEYDTQDRVVALRVGDATIGHAYDYLGRLETVTTPAGKITYQHLPAQGIIVRTLPNGVQTIRQHHPDGRLESITHARPDRVILAKFSYAYHPDGRIKSAKEGWLSKPTKEMFYVYDMEQRLVAVESPRGVKLHEYSYDAVGNRTEARGGGRAVASASDWAGRLIRHDGQTCEHDAAGNLTRYPGPGGAQALSYSAEGQLAAAGKVAYRHDGEGRLLARTVGDAASTYLPDPRGAVWRPLLADEGGKRTVYVWEGDTPLLAIGEAGTDYYLHDHLGSVRAVADGDGKAARRLDYCPFGTPQGEWAGLRPGFAGLFFDADARLYLSRARGYDPALGRFVQPDPQHRTPLGSQKDLSDYAYCGADPVNHKDVDGAAPVDLNEQMRRNMEQQAAANRLQEQLFRQQQQMNQQRMLHEQLDRQLRFQDQQRLLANQMAQIQRVAEMTRLSVAQPPMPPMPRFGPTHVGGVYLGGAGRALQGLGAVQGVAVAADGRLVLLSEGKGAIDLPPLRLDDVVTIFRIVYTDPRGPFVSIDPDPADPKGPQMLVRGTPGLENTYVLWVLFECDRLMKCYSVLQDNVTQEDVTSTVPGYAALFKLPRRAGKDIWSRFWFAPREAVRKGDGRLTLLDVPIELKTESMELKDGKLLPAPGRETAFDRGFSRWFTDRYDAIAAERKLRPPPESGITTRVEVFAELRRFTLIAAIAETLRDQGRPMPAWMRDYPVRPCPVPTITPGRKFKIGVSGGATTRAEKVTTVADARAAALAPAVQKAVADAAPLTRVEVKQGGRDYQAVALPGDAGRAFGANWLRETDLTVAVGEGHTIALTRHSHSYFGCADVFGRGWTLDLPRLEKFTRVTKREGNKTTGLSVLTLTTPLNRVSVTFGTIRHVPELGVKWFVPDVADPGVLALGKVDFPKAGGKTQVVVFRDGRRWHFDNQGRFVADEKAPFTTVYVRDKATGRLDAIQGWHGDERRAEVRLAYDAAGRVALARGSDGQVVRYAYHDGALAQVEGRDGCRAYEYRDGRVSATHEADRGATLARATAGLAGATGGGLLAPAALLAGRQTRRFDHDERGRLLRETNGRGEVSTYSVKESKDGFEVVAGRERATYDRTMRPLRRRLADGTDIEWRYAADGGVVLTSTPPGGGAVARKLDAAGRPTEVRLGGKLAERVEWGADGLPRSLTRESSRTQVGYDSAGLISQVVLTPAAAGAKETCWLTIKDGGRDKRLLDTSGLDVTLKADAKGRLTDLKTKRAEVTVRRADGSVVTTTSWKDFREIVKRDAEGVEVDRGGQKATARFEEGRPVHVRRFDGGEYHVGYEAGRLRSVQTPSGLALGYEEDDGGRRLVVRCGRLYRLEYRFDRQGRLLELTKHQGEE